MAANSYAGPPWGWLIRLKAEPPARPEFEPPRFADRMAAAADAEAGRKIIWEHGCELGRVEAQAGFEPTVGPKGAGFSCLKKRELANLVRRIAKVNPPLGRYAQALVDDGLAMEPIWRRLYQKENEQWWRNSTRKGAWLYGSPCVVLIAGSSRTWKARYAIRCLEDVYPSHGLSFEPNEWYEFQNERDYRSKDNAERVLAMVADFRPAFLVSDNPDAINGPPITDPRGNVLAGNSRIMALQRVYAAGRGKAYRDLVISLAHTFGLSPREVAREAQPVLVRELDDEETGSYQTAIGDFNRPGTAPLSNSERAVADGQRVSAEALEYMAECIALEGEGATLALTLGGPRGPKILVRLVADGVISQQEKAQYLDERGLVTDEGKRRLTRLLVGRLFDTSEDYEHSPVDLRAKLERVAGSIARVEDRDAWRITEDVKRAVLVLAELRGRAMRLDSLLAQGGLFGGNGHSERVLALVTTLQQPPHQCAAAFRAYARTADYSRNGTLDVFEPPKAEDAFFAAFAWPDVGH
jgi:hypothetical protein